MTLLLLALSVALVVAGVVVLVRDARRGTRSQTGKEPPLPFFARHLHGLRRKDLPSTKRAQQASVGKEPLAPHPKAAAATASARPHPVAPEANRIAPSQEGSSDPETLAHWQAFEPVLASATRAVNDAFAPGGVALSSPTYPFWNAETGCYRIALGITADGRPAGSVDLLIEHEAIKVAGSDVAASMGGRVAASRGDRHLAWPDVNIQSLAEAIAACAWPIATAARQRS